MQLLHLGPHPLLLFDDVVHELAALGSHRFFGCTLDYGDSPSIKFGLHLIERKYSAHGEMTASLWQVNASHMRFLLLLGPLKGRSEAIVKCFLLRNQSLSNFLKCPFSYLEKILSGCRGKVQTMFL